MTPLYVRVSMGAGELFWGALVLFIVGVLIGMAAQHVRSNK